MLHIKRKKPVFFLVFLLLTLFRYAPAETDYFLRSWSRTDGLPSNTVEAIRQTGNGFLWIGTPAGLARFDGRRFRLFPLPPAGDQKNGHVTALCADSSGRLWIGTGGSGLYSLHNGIWKHFSTAEGLADNHVRVISGDRRGNIWIGTDFGLSRWNGNGFRNYYTADGLYDNIITALATDSRGYLWIGTLRGGLAQFQEGVVRVYGYRDGLQDVAVTALLADSSDNLWIGTLHGLFLMRGGGGVIEAVPGTAYTPVNAIIADGHGSIRIATMADGVKIIRHNRMVDFPGSRELGGANIRSLYSDRDGNLWAGSDARGLFRLRKSRVKNITRSEGLPGRAVSAVLQDRRENLWIGLANQGVCCFRGGRLIRHLTAAGGLNSSRVTALSMDDANRLWIGTRDAGLNVVAGEKIGSFSTASGLTSNTVTALLADRSGRIWIGTDLGLNRLNPENEAVDYPAGRKEFHVRVLLEAADGSVFIGSRDGLTVLRKHSRQRILPAEGRPAADVLALFEDRRQALWIGTNGNGLFRLDANRLESWNTDDGLPDNHIFSISEDAAGDLWMSSYRGIFRISQARLEADSLPLQAEVFDESDGMVSSRCSSGGTPAVWKMQSGQLGYPTAGGVVLVDPRQLSRPGKPRPVLVEEVRVNGKPTRAAEELRLTPPVRHLAIDFTAADLSAPEKLRFSYRLAQADTGWKITSGLQQRSAEYFDLPPGRYRFQVATAGSGGEPVTELAIEIRQPFYESRLFFALLSAALLIAGALVVLKRRKKNSRKTEKYSTSTLDPRQAEAVIPRLLKLMEEEKIYLNPDLTLRELSRKLHIQYNHLSRIINEQFRMSYNDFINKYRIEAAREMLQSPDHRERTILEIIYESGFYSKSVFNTAFKKATGMTPSQYRKSRFKPAEK